MLEQPAAVGAAAGPALEDAPAGYWSRRWMLVSGCFLSILVCYIDRVNISYAILPMSTEYGWDNATQGWVLSSFFMGYLATQLLGGWWAARIGGPRASHVRGALVVGVHAADAARGVVLVRRTDRRAHRHGPRRGRCVPRDLPALRALDSAARARARSGAERQRDPARHGRGDARSRPGWSEAYGWPSCSTPSAPLGLVWYAFWHFCLERASRRRTRHPSERSSR